MIFFFKAPLTKSTSEMYRNIPAIPEKIHRLERPRFPTASPTAIPMNDSTEDKQLQSKACLIVIPFLRRTAKSPMRYKIDHEYVSFSRFVIISLETIIV